MGGGDEVFLERGERRVLRISELEGRRGAEARRWAIWGESVKRKEGEKGKKEGLGGLWRDSTEAGMGDP